MIRLKLFFKEKWIYAAALCLPVFIALIHSAIADTWVTGNGNLATGDMVFSIIPLAFEAWDHFHTGGFAEFTWHLLGGMDYQSFIGGYMNSPFMLIMLLLPRKAIPDYMQLIMIVKWALSSLTMTWFFYNTRFNKIKERKNIVSLFLGLAFALGNGVMSYMLYVQFMDAVICFPILLILVEKMVRENKWKLYYIVLTFTIWSYMYTAFQICVFLVFWFFFNLSMEKEQKGKKCAVFFGSSFLAGMTWLGTVITGLKWAQNRNEFAGDALKQEYYSGLLIKPYEFIKQLFVFRNISGAADISPNIYFSITALFLILLFPVIKINIKEKIYIVCMTLLLLASFFFGRISIFWHLFSVPNGVYHRFMYLFVFIVLFEALYVLQHLEDINITSMAAAMLALLLIYVYALLHIGNSDTVVSYLISVLIMVFVFLVLMLYKKKSISHKDIILILAVCGVIELTVNSYSVFSFYDNSLYYGEGGTVDEELKLLEKAKLQDGERITSLTPVKDIGLVAGVNSDCGFSSVINANNSRLHAMLGMVADSNVSFGSRGASPLVNLLFNIRYGVGESEVLFSDCDLIDKNDDIQLYRMNRVAGLGYMVEPSVLDWDGENKNCFQYQNDFVNKSVGGDDIFYPFSVHPVCADVEGNISEPDGEFLKSGCYLYSYYTKYGNAYDSHQLEFTVEEDADLYMYYKGTENMIFVYVDDEMIQDDRDYYAESTYHIGNVRKGQKIMILAAPHSGGVVGSSVTISFTFAKFDDGAYQRAYESLSSNVYKIESWNPDHISGDIHADEDGIMMTSVPVSEGLNVYVDGSLEDVYSVGGAMIGVDLKKGDHTVEFIYEPEKRILDKAAVVISFMIYIVLCFADRKKKDIK